MSGSIANYGFLPWMRQGISGKIDNPAASATNERATLPVEIIFNGTSISKNAAIIGPGDILGISDKVYVKQEPDNLVFNYEANNLAYIEFYEEDFPWRYTPTNVTDGKLTPWLALLMLRDDEFTLTQGDPNGLPAKIEILVPISDVLHPSDEHWAWAHVHVNNPSGTSGGALMTHLKNTLPSNPELAVSRLLCSRKLEPNTAYTAFVVPAFKTGRLAGLNPTDPLLATTSSLEMAWSGSTINVEFPVYKSWRCGTGALGDFETLVRSLKPTVLDSDLGTRPMNIAETGMGLDGLAVDDEIGMEGALAPAAFVPVAAANNASTDDYTVGLKSILNLSDTMQTSSYVGSSAIPNPYVTATSIQNDPVIVPPTYGLWHADIKKIDGTSPLWLQELNLDPRYRAAAGLGASIVRERQEEYMETAWKQIGEVTAVNNKIAKARLALEVSNSIYTKHFIGAAASTEEEEFNKTVKTIGLGLKKLKFNTVDVLSVSTPPVGASVPDLPSCLSAIKASDLSNMTKSGADSGFRKLTRSRSSVVTKIEGKASGTINKEILSKMNEGDLSAAPKVNSPSDATTLTSYIASVPGTSSSPYTASGMMAVTSPSEWSSVYYGQADQFKKTLQFLDKREAEINPPAPKINKPHFISTVQTKLNPEVAITERVKKLINMQIPSGIAAFKVKPIMAYPIIDEPMYDDLIQKSYEYLMPNLNQVPNNVVTLLSTNTKFIEAYMAGLNHEFSRELLWREYPTDQRGSYFRRFWDIKDTIDTGTSDYLNDIKPMHMWTGALGENHTSRHSGGGDKLVLMIRGDLLKKYPNALIYAQKAEDYLGSSAPEPRTLKEAVDISGAITNDVKFPIFRANLNPDIVLLGFDVSKNEALGLTAASDPLKTNAGWYFVFRERPGQLRFGLDMPSGDTSGSSWDDLSWANMDADGNVENVKTINISNASTNDLIVDLNTASIPLVGSMPDVEWGANSAVMAWILNQAPAMVAIHAEDMIG